MHYKECIACHGQGRLSYADLPKCRLEPFLPLEEEYLSEQDDEGEADDIGVTVCPVEFRHDEVHAEPAGDELQGKEDHRDDRQGLHGVVLDEVDLRLVGLADLLEVLLVTEDEVVQTVEFFIDEDEFRFHAGELVGHL